MPYLSVGAGRQDGNGLIHRGQQRPQGQADLLRDESTAGEAAAPHARPGAPPSTHASSHLLPATAEKTSMLPSSALSLISGMGSSSRPDPDLSAHHSTSPGSGGRDGDWRIERAPGVRGGARSSPLLSRRFPAQKGPHAAAGAGTMAPALRAPAESALPQQRVCPLPAPSPPRDSPARSST